MSLFLDRIRKWLDPREEAITAAMLDDLPLSRIASVSFYKRDELATDLICCDVEIAGHVWSFHEEMEGWDRLVAHLEKLPGFCPNWFASVVKPAFEPSVIVAYSRVE